jgi:ribose transport system substrate-binding protein
MSTTLPPGLPAGLGRRRFLLGGAAISAGAVLTGCTGNSDDGDDTEAVVDSGGEGDNAESGPKVTIGFLAPAADHGWIAAISKNAKAQAAEFDDVTLNAAESSNDVNVQISQMETFISDKVDVIVALPYDGKSLTQVARDAMEAGIPVVNLDRIFASSLAYRTYIGGDNYGMGVAAGNYIGSRLADEASPVIAEIQGIAALPLTQDRSRGFKDALATYGLEVTNQVSAEFTSESGEEVTSNLLQAAPKIDAIWNHDDDQGIGVMAAIANAERDEFFLVGGAGSANVMRDIQSGETVVEATVTYSPSMASSAIMLARLIAQGKKMSDLVENEVPASITLASATVTADNVEEYLPLGFES